MTKKLDTKYIYRDTSSNALRVRCPGEYSVSLNTSVFTIEDAIRVRDAVLSNGTFEGEKLRRTIYLKRAEKNARNGKFV